MPRDTLLATLKPALAAVKAAKLPGVVQADWYGTPSLKVNDKGFIRVKEAGVLVLMCSMEEKEFLMDAAPDIYFETDHYKGWPAVLVRVANISIDELARRAEVAWRLKASKALIKEFDGALKSAPPKPKVKKKTKKKG